MGKPAIKVEVEAIKAAIKRRRAVAKDEFAVEEKEALVDEIFAEITARAPRATRTREDRAKVRTSESMDDTKALSAEAVALGLISPEAHAETIRIADGVARKYGAGVIDPETGEITEQPETATKPGQDTKSPSQCTTAGENFGGTVDGGHRGTVSTAGEPASAILVSRDSREAATEYAGNAGGSLVKIQHQDAPVSKPIRTIADYRPNCLHPERCGASGLDHCFSCSQSIREAAR
jgi:hypothetical protein